MNELTNRWQELGARWAMEDINSYMAAVARISRDTHDLMSAYRILIAEAEDRFGIYNGKIIEAGALEYEDIMEIQAALEKSSGNNN